MVAASSQLARWRHFKTVILVVRWQHCNTPVGWFVIRTNLTHYIEWVTKETRALDISSNRLRRRSVGWLADVFVHVW